VADGFSDNALRNNVLRNLKRSMKYTVRHLFLATIFLGMGCTNQELEYSNTENTTPNPGSSTSETESTVVITPLLTLSAGTKYYFHNNLEQGEAAVRNAQADGSCSSQLTLGTYRLLAANADASDVEFRGMGSTETAGVYLMPAATRQSDSYTQVVEPGDVYLLTIGEVVVEKGKTATYSSTPRLLTHTLTLELDLSAIAETVTGFSGTLNGFYPGISLGSGQPITTGAATTFMAFSADGAATGSTPGTYLVPIRSFSLLNPAANDTPYTSVLQLQVATVSGMHAVSIDLTTNLTAVFDAFGHLPSDIRIPVVLEIAANPTEPGEESEAPAQSIPDGGADDWEAGGNYEGTLEMN